MVSEDVDGSQGQLVLDWVLRTCLEQLGAVTALQQECLALSDISELRAQPIDLAGCYERWELAKLAKDPRIIRTLSAYRPLVGEL